MKLVSQKRSEPSALSFEVRATTALGISIVMDALDYVGAPIFALPIVGDVLDAAVIAVLYRLTGSKTSTAINSLEFIPFIGDMIPAYTISTLLWILRESLHRRKQERSFDKSAKSTDSSNRINGNIKYENSTDHRHNTQDSFRTKAARLYTTFRSRA